MSDSRGVHLEFSGDVRGPRVVILNGVDLSGSCISLVIHAGSPTQPTTVTLELAADRVSMNGAALLEAVRFVGRAESVW